MYEFTPPPDDSGQAHLPLDAGKDIEGEWEEITLSLPGDTPLAVPADEARWERRNGRIVATYERHELAWAVVQELNRRLSELEGRLRRGRDVITEAEESEIGELREHWDALADDYARFMHLQNEIMLDELGYSDEQLSGS
jgi:hypothetical protein